MQGPTSGPRVSPWGVMVKISALLVVGGAAALRIGRVASSDVP